jgi:protein pelota
MKTDFKNGLVQIRIQTIDDLWYLNKIINPGDFVSGVTYRKIVVGTKEGERKRVFLKIKVAKLDFTDFTNLLKILGVIVECKDDRVPIGEHHSFTLGVNDELNIFKKKWTSIDKNYLQRSKKGKDSNIMLVACDYGDATFAFYHEYGIEYAGSLKDELGGKKELKSYEHNKQAFLKLLLSTINDTASRRKVKKVLIGGASMITDSLKKLYKDYEYLKNKTSFAKIGYSGENGIKELIRKGELDKLLRDNVYSEHVRLVNKLLELIGKGDKATYGFKQVKEAIESGAVKHLITTDDFVKKNRNKLEKILNMTEASRGTINIIPSNTEHGEQVDNLTGITAILRFKIYK